MGFLSGIYVAVFLSVPGAGANTMPLVARRPVLSHLLRLGPSILWTMVYSGSVRKSCSGRLCCSEKIVNKQTCHRLFPFVTY
ncbi:hypothetical protein FOCC_FOCC006417 [Frankliniella occidentalis]|nr:hypothetical protein FOCC_FOCC006417 [Frankliniella occidentalis]